MLRSIELVRQSTRVGVDRGAAVEGLALWSIFMRFGIVHTQAALSFEALVAMFALKRQWKGTAVEAVQSADLNVHVVGRVDGIFGNDVGWPLIVGRGRAAWKVRWVTADERPVAGDRVEAVEVAVESDSRGVSVNYRLGKG